MKRSVFLVTVLTCTILLNGQHSQAQNPVRQESWALAVKASTTGFGADVVYGFSKDISFRLGLDRLNYTTNINFAEQGISYNADIFLTLGTISLLGDFYLGKFVYVTAGAGYNYFNAQLKGHASEAFPFGDIQIPAEMIGNFDFTVHPEKRIAPYIGIGLGRTIAAQKKVGFALDFGGYYMGAPQISIVSDGLLSPTSNPEHHQAENLEKQISQYNFIPVIKLSLNYRISGQAEERL